MSSQKSPFNCLSVDLELETIRRFRDSLPLITTEWQVYREVASNSAVLCLNFVSSTPNQMNKEQWQKFAKRSLDLSHALGLANALVIKQGDRILGWMTLNHREYFGEFFVKG